MQEAAVRGIKEELQLTEDSYNLVKFEEPKMSTSMAFSYPGVRLR